MAALDRLYCTLHIDTISMEISILCFKGLWIKISIKWHVSVPEDYTVKPILSGHSKLDKTKVLKTNGTCSLMKVESIAECSLGAFCNTFDLH